MSQEVQTEERVETEAVAQETAKTEKSGRKSVDILMVALKDIVYSFRLSESLFHYFCSDS